MSSVSITNRTARILLVDADEGRRARTAAALERAGHEVHAHGSLAEAGQAGVAWDLVLADSGEIGDRPEAIAALLAGGKAGDQLRDFETRNQILSRKLGAAQRNLREQIHLQQRSREVFYTDLSRVMAIFDNLVDGIVFTGPDGKVILVNPAAGEMLEVPPFSALGKPLASLSGTRKLLDALSTHRRGPLPEGGREEEVNITGRIAGDRSFTVHTSEVPDYQGKLSGVLSLLRDVTSRKKTEQLKNQFLSIVAHELRTPLTTIKAFATILDQGIQGELTEGHRPLVKHMLNQSDRLGHEIDKIVCLGRLESSDFAPDLQPVTARQVMRTLLSPFDAEADKKGVRLQVKDHSAGAEVDADLQDLRRAIRALTENALKFTPTGGTVELRIRPEDGDLVFEVTDTGIGIAPADHNVIFEKFMQLENPLTRKYGGSGLGLSFAAEIVEAHQSRIEVESELGRGATFRFRLAIRRPSGGQGSHPTEERAPPPGDGE